MKIESGSTKVEIEEKDYAAIQKVSNIGLFKIISDQFGYWRLLNLLRINEKFKKKCEKKGINPKLVAPKFFAQYIDSASLEDDDTIQEMWADLLAEESQDPGSISLRTISSLKVLSSSEAVTFRSLYTNALYVNNEIVIYNDRNDDNKSIDDIIRLVDCGLLVSESTSITANVSVMPESSSIISMSPMRKYAIFAQNKSITEGKCIIPIFSLTRAGQDILSATLDKDNKDNYWSIAKKIKRNSNDLLIKMFRIIDFDKKTGTVRYSCENLLK